jgi:hypothetical protein
MSSAHAALIVDADPKGLEALVYGFQGADWRITACPAPETASLLIKASAAELLVIASRSDHDKANALIGQIREKEASRALPILLLGPPELRAEIKDRADVHLLALPAHVYDVLTASQLLIAAAALATQRPGEELRFATTITTKTTISLVRTMIGLGWSGQLQLRRKGRQGELLFHMGEVTGAQVGQLQGMAAAQHLLVWNDGEVELHLRPVARRGQLHQTAVEFLEEFERFQRDFGHAIKDIGPLGVAYTHSDEQLEHSAGMIPAEVTPVVRLCDGQRTLADIIDQSPFRVLDTVRIVGRLVEVGVATRREPGPERTANPPRSQLDEFWETAQIVGTPGTSRSRQATTPVPTQPAAASDQANGASVLQAAAPRPQRRTLEIGTPQPTDATTAPARAGEVASSQRPASPPIVEQPPPSSRQSAVETAPMHVGAVQDAPVAGSGAPAVAAPHNTRASGAIEVGKRGARHTQTAPHGTKDRPSVVVEGTPPQPAVPAPSVAPAVGTSQTSAGALASPARADLRTDAPPALVAGEIQVAPSRKTSRQAPARVSIQLDTSLAAEPAGSSASSQSQPAINDEPDKSRVTGEMHVIPSGRNARAPVKAERVSGSFQIDPSLTAEASRAPTPATAPQAPSQSPAEGGPVRHPSGGFSAVESDFFDREADLYKEEKTESFADLDDKSGTGGKGSGKNGKRGRR